MQNMKGEIVYLTDPMKSKIQRFIGKLKET